MKGGGNRYLKRIWIVKGKFGVEGGKRAAFYAEGNKPCIRRVNVWRPESDKGIKDKKHHENDWAFWSSEYNILEKAADLLVPTARKNVAINYFVHYNGHLFVWQKANPYNIWMENSKMITVCCALLRRQNLEGGS